MNLESVFLTFNNGASLILTNVLKQVLLKLVLLSYQWLMGLPING